MSRVVRDFFDIRNHRNMVLFKNERVDLVEVFTVVQKEDLVLGYGKRKIG